MRLKMIKYVLLGIGIGIALAGVLLFIYCAIKIDGIDDRK